MCDNYYSNQKIISSISDFVTGSLTISIISTEITFTTTTTNSTAAAATATTIITTITAATASAATTTVTDPSVTVNSCAMNPNSTVCLMTDNETGNALVCCYVGWHNKIRNKVHHYTFKG